MHEGQVKKKSEVRWFELKGQTKMRGGQMHELTKQTHGGSSSVGAGKGVEGCSDDLVKALDVAINLARAVRSDSMLSR